jgi:SAM-dependent methyltransferase
MNEMRVAPHVLEAVINHGTMRNLLWTLPRPEVLLHRIARALRPDGVILFSDGFWNHNDGEAPGSVHWSHTRFAELYGPIAGELPLYRGVSSAMVERLVTAAGFSHLCHWADRFERSPCAGVTDDFFLLTASVAAAEDRAWIG